MKSGSMGSLAHANTYYNPAKSAMYSRYSTSDWELTNRSNFTLADKQRQEAERVRAEVFRAVKVTDQLTRSRQQSNTKKLGLRVKDISFWKEELLKEISYMTDETASLEEHKRMLDKALDDTVEPLRIAEECLTRRELRVGIDQVHDDVERCLTKEVEVTKKCQNKMKRLLDKVVVQLRMNALSQKACENDAKDKHHAQGIDDRMQQLRNTSSQLGFFPGIEDQDNTVSVPDSWAKFTEDNLTRSHMERQQSEKLRGIVDACIRACLSEMANQHNAVNSALAARVNQLNNAKDGLHAHLNKASNEIRDLERSIEFLEKAISDKEAPLKVAQTRLDERSRRISVELCNDKPMAGLQTEVREIMESMRILQDKLHTARLALSRLQKAKATLENDIAVKEQSIQIDLQGCTTLRKNLCVDPSRVGPNFSMPLISY